MGAKKKIRKIIILLETQITIIYQRKWHSKQQTQMKVDTFKNAVQTSEATNLKLSKWFLIDFTNLKNGQEPKSMGHILERHICVTF